MLLIQGPKGYPIIGSIPELLKLDPVIAVALKKLGDKYGPVCGIYFGKKPSVVINGWENCKEVLMSDEFGNRPFLRFTADGHPLSLGNTVTHYYSTTCILGNKLLIFAFLKLAPVIHRNHVCKWRVLERSTSFHNASTARLRFR